LQLPGERSSSKRTYVEDVFDNLKNERGNVGFYLILAWQTNLQTRSNADAEMNDLEQHTGIIPRRFKQETFLFFLIIFQEFFWISSISLTYFALRKNFSIFPLTNVIIVLSMDHISTY
jgi:hypothetical protein